MTETTNCMCHIHLKLEPGKPCLGHGSNCPCTALIKKQTEEEKIPNEND